MTKIHWLGIGLSSVPGIKRLANLDANFVLWCRRTDDGKTMLDGCLSQDVRLLSWDALKADISAGDVVVSMLPASEHLTVADICLNSEAHFVSSSYVSDEMRAFHEAAETKGLTFINEVGLDPGLDHLLAHDLIESFKESEYATGDYQHSFRSYCGGFPSVPNDFKYKFSWSPVGVLRALKSPASWMQDGAVQHTDCPWKSLKEYAAPIASGERFQAYPNRDSIPFIKQYHFPEQWNVSEFVRGTLRLEGWANAWQPIFDTIDNLKPEDTETVLKEMSDELWKNYSYQPDELDRVVLCVEHEVKDGDQTIWHQSYSMDEVGNEKGSAMARLVSLTVSLAVQSIVAKELPAGVLAAVSERKQVRSWIDQLRSMGESIKLTDHIKSI
ncbi:MAG: saccharopine dehydrogenase NADP-binding domain-containing protein [Akkermansiaceae bacterium]